jgi:ABC-type nitrate/sulfonate/bicarbonate transport system ATPase subunit
MSQPQIAVDKVSHVYRPPRGRPVLALEDVSLDVQQREFLALLGPSGCGKSTLLYLIGGFLPVERGAIAVNGAPVKAPGPDRGIVFQHFALFPWKTSEHSPDGRAVRRARRADAASDAGRTAWHLAAHAEDRDLRHP